MLMGCRESCKLGPRRSQRNNRRRFFFSHSVRIYVKEILFQPFSEDWIILDVLGN